MRRNKAINDVLWLLKVLILKTLYLRTFKVWQSVIFLFKSIYKTSYEIQFKFNWKLIFCPVIKSFWITYYA